MKSEIVCKLLVQKETISTHPLNIRVGYLTYITPFHVFPLNIRLEILIKMFPEYLFKFLG